MPGEGEAPAFVSVERGGRLRFSGVATVYFTLDADDADAASAAMNERLQSLRASGILNDFEAVEDPDDVWPGEVEDAPEP